MPTSDADRVDDSARGQHRRQSEAVQALAFAVADRRHVDGDNHRPVARAASALDQAAGQLTVAPRVQLKPVRGAGGGGNLFDRVSAGAGQHQPAAGVLGAPGDGHIALPIGETVEAGGSDEHRQRERLALELGRQVVVGMPGEHALAQPPLPERVAVLGERDPIVGRTVDIGPDHQWNRSTSRPSVALDADRRLAPAEPELDRGHRFIAMLWLSLRICRRRRTGAPPRPGSPAAPSRAAHRDRLAPTPPARAAVGGAVMATPAGSTSNSNPVSCRT